MSNNENFCNLTKTQAESRYSCLVYGSVHYSMSFILQKGESYSAHVDIKFTTNDIELGDNVFLEYVGKTFKITDLNGQVPELVDDSHNHMRKNGYITLPKNLLKKNDENTVSISIENAYSSDGNGLHSMSDIDGNFF